MARVVAVVLAGGGGTRLWPLSTPRHPKPFLSPIEGDSLYRRTLLRHQGLVDGCVTVASDLLSPLCKKHHEGLTVEMIVEPSPKNTAPAVALAALSVQGDPDDLLLFLPADAWISDIEAYRASLQLLIQAVGETDGFYGVLGVVPTHPATGYGYIEAEEGDAVRCVRRFTEKPVLSVAEKWWHRDNYFWNAGVFLFRRRHLLDLLRSTMPDNLQQIQRFLETKNEQAWAGVTSISIDYALAEKSARQALVMPLRAGWSDLGTLENWWQVMADAGIEKSDTPLRLGIKADLLQNDSLSVVRGAGGILFRCPKK